MIHIITDSISPQTKAVATNIATGSVGISTILEMIPTAIGVIGTIVGIVFSIVLTRNAIIKSKQDAAEHKLKMKLMQKKFDSLE